nr:Chain B, Exocyst complex component 4 [Homo sapiens]
ATKDKKITTV